MSRPAIDFLSFRLDVVSELAKRQVNLDYERLGVNLRELRVLRLAHAQPGITQSGVVEGAYMEKTLISKLTTALVQRQLIRREIGAEDARLVHLYLTPAGRKLVEQCEKIGRQMEQRLLADLAPEELLQFEAVLAKLTRALQNP